ncbi:sugar ABC transporter ATP-binding protein [Taklimakanibacter lacteus]|uniref:sugar ABC transporter ATP-binding protein n=1 Tax=Taklimakanibacter lacteus TaxID=2268456 RepID=UPI000E6625C8
MQHPAEPTGGGDSYRLTELTKRFPGVVAVSGVNLTVRRGEVHGIIGRNGAGKSVLMSLISGLARATSGGIAINGHSVDIASYNPIKAHALGVSLVPQEPKFAARLSIADNLFMGRPIDRSLGFINSAAMRKKAKAVAAEVGLSLDPDEPMARLPIESQQLLAFGKAQFIEEAQIILLDEITASLSRERKQMLLALLRRLVRAAPERSYTLISHHVSEIMEFCDRVTVMRDSKAVATLDVAHTTAAELANWIVGDIPVTRLDDYNATPSKPSAPFVSVKDLSLPPNLTSASFEVAIGEVIGLAGLDGSGKEEAVEALFGMKRPDAGAIAIEGRPVGIASPAIAIRHGIGFLPKHRERQAVIPGRSIVENTLISSYRSFSNALGLIDETRAEAMTRAKMTEFKVKAAGPFTAMTELSGGNKQKVLIGRLTLSSPRLFILNEPTRGVDLATKPEILRAIREELALASGVIMLSESEDELIAVCDRILVFFRGRIVSVLNRGTQAFNVATLYKTIQGV